MSDAGKIRRFFERIPYKKRHSYARWKQEESLLRHEGRRVLRKKRVDRSGRKKLFGRTVNDPVRQRAGGNLELCSRGKKL